ncbi:glycosyltransferase [Mucilaginibacter sp. ZB1P21]|uniref:Glycosyltransferase n=1 Tax=Mucilaginibacter glaciei TaxID=2772109 RepID=A0A926NP18_9SPHI|nr:glycosyltransferase [Mucilaginibacter glaciei]
MPLNIFYREPNPDRWLKFDRYPRQLIRRIIRGRPRPGGVMMVALELLKGLDILKIPYRFNDFKYICKHPNELACIIGKPQLLFDKKWKNPILFGAGVFSHPKDCPDLFDKYPNVKKILVPGDWMQQMFEKYYGSKVVTWPVGIDTQKWHQGIKAADKRFDFLIYDKIRWKHNHYNDTLVKPIKDHLSLSGKTFSTIKYGAYTHAELMQKISVSEAVIFLCEHETQGLAYQQILSTNTPILAWDRGGMWQDPSYYPDKVKFEPVSSVPYWDKRCGVKFTDATNFISGLRTFINKQQNLEFAPRDYILKNLSLEVCAQKYVDIALNVIAGLP